MELPLKVVIVEDEPPAAKRLEKMLAKARPNIKVLAKLESVKASVEFFEKQQKIDLCFMDIQLADGISFEIFSQVDIEAPIIFTTAYDDYSLQAFKVNSIDYLLKPIDQLDLEKSLKKFEKFTGNLKSIDPDKINDLLIALQRKNYKEQFLIKSGQSLSIIQIPEIAYFYSEDGYVQLVTNDNRKHLIEYSLDQLSEIIDPQLFFRINRKYILQMPAIRKINSYFNSRLKLNLSPASKEDIIVSRERVGDFKKWLDR